MAFKFKLEAENPKRSGYMGYDKKGWIVVRESDAALTFETYEHQEVTYYKVKGGSWDGKYLSLNRNDYLGLYRWPKASGWTLQDDHMVSAWNDEHVSYAPTDDGYVYAKDSYTWFSVTKE